MGAGAIADYDGLIEACRERVPELGISYAILDQIAGWTDTYATKVLGPRPIKRLSWDMLFVLLGALGLEMQIVANAEATERLKNSSLFEHRKFMLSKAEHTPITMRFPRRHYRKIGAKGGKHKRSCRAKRRLAPQGRKGGKACFANMTKEQRSAHGRRLALIRWEQVKAAVKG